MKRFLLFNFILCLLAGCATEHIPVYPPMPPAEAMKILGDRAHGIHTISAQGLITLTRDNGDTIRLDAAVVLQPPEKARLRAWKFGRAVFDMTLTPDGLWLIAPTEDERRKEILAAGANTGALTRQWLQLITGGFEGPQTATRVDGNHLTLHQARNDGSTLIATIDRKTLTPRRYILKDASGKERFSLSLSHYIEIGVNVWPREIEAISSSGSILIELRDVEMNADLPPTAFHPPARAQKIETPVEAAKETR